MATNNNKDGKVTAGELFNKLKGKNADAVKGSDDIEPLSSADAAEEKRSANGFSIDVSSEKESDSELDINELLKKYMPEYDEKASAGKNGAERGGVLSGLKRFADDDFSDDLPYGSDDGFSEDDSLISALDSAFGPENAEGDYAFDTEEEARDEEYSVGGEEPVSRDEKKNKNKREKKSLFSFGFFARKKKADAEEEESLVEEEMTFVEDEEPSEEISFGEVFAQTETENKDEVLREAEALEALAAAEDVSFRTTDIRLGDIAELESALTEAHPGNKITPEDRKAMKNDEEHSILREMLEDDIDASELMDASEVTETENTEAVEGLEFLAAESESEEIVLAEAETDASGGLETDEAAFFEEEIDPTDLNLRVAFGLDEEEEEDVRAAAKQLGDRLEEKQYRREKRAHLDRPEFVDKTQIPKIRKEYQQRLASLWIRLGICVVLTAVLMWFENIAFFTDLFTGSPKQFAGVFDPAVYPVVYIMTSLQLMLFACLCAYEQIVDGFKSLFRGIPKAETVLSFLVVTGIVYSAVLARLIETPEEPVMFNFAVALAAVLTLIYAIYNTGREKMNFDIVSSKKTKHIMRRLPDEESMSQAKAFMEQTDACDVMKIEKTDFIDGFFGRMYQPDPTVTIFMICMMSVAAALAVLVGFFVNMRGGDSVEVLNAAYIALLISAPLSVLIAFSYPFYRATRAANEYDSAIIGETSLGEYSDASIISFDDRNVFPSYSVKIQNIKIYNNARVDRVLYYAASVFAYAGGPLQDVFEVATLEMGHSEDVRIFDTEAGFLASQVNGVNIIFGSCEKLREKGFVIPEENASDDVDFSSELSIMYMFREDKLVAKMYVKYVMDGDIDLILKQFQGTGLYVCVRTFDPNIDERMIAKKLNMRRIPLKVVRYASPDEVTMYEAKADSGLVTSASPKSLLQVISYCDKVLHTRKVNIALCVLSVLLGIAVVSLMILSGTVSMVNSLFVAVYHLLWIIPMVLAAKVFIR